MIGEMPGRQICLYDKRADSLIKQKFYWADVWKLDLFKHRTPIWRNEFRAGREEFKRLFPYGRSFEQVERGITDIVNELMTKARYAHSSDTDCNASRWPTQPIWEFYRAKLLEMVDELDLAIQPQPRDLISPLCIKKRDIQKQLLGLSATYAALAGLKIDKAQDLPGVIAEALRELERDEAGTFVRKLECAQCRHGKFEK